jgi:hypothetical protein
LDEPKEQKMRCAYVWVNGFVDGTASGYQYVCFPDLADGGDAYTEAPPAPTGNAPSGDVNFIPNPGGGSIVAPDNTANTIQTTSGFVPAWDSGARSIQELPPNWIGTISLDIPDVQGARQGGVAVGLAYSSAVSPIGRTGYGHLRYGLVFTATTVRIIHDGAVTSEKPYAPIRAMRVGAGTDTVSAAIYGTHIKWVVNGDTLLLAPFSMIEPFVLDATLYLPYDAVNNPVLTPGSLPVPSGGEIVTGLERLAMTIDAMAPSGLAITLPSFAAQLSETQMANLFGDLSRFQITLGDYDGMEATLKPLGMIASDLDSFGFIQVTLGQLGMQAGMNKVDTGVPYSVLDADLPELSMVATAPPTATVNAALRGLVMRASVQTTYAELGLDLGALRMVGFGGELTPLVQVMEAVVFRAPVEHSAYVGLTITEKVGGTVTAEAWLVAPEDGTEEISAQDSASFTATLLDSVAEMIGAGERATVFAFRTVDGVPVDAGEAWVVNARSNASSRYEQFGFGSFAVVKGRQFGARADGVYLLEGDTDAGIPINSGISLGKHNFGTQANKYLPAVHVGISSTGAVFLKIGDGVNEYTYRARRFDDRLRTQRFDPGRGLRSNYFTFELTSEADAFELDSVQFTVIASQRRI